MISEKIKRLRSRWKVSGLRQVRVKLAQRHSNWFAVELFVDHERLCAGCGNAQSHAANVSVGKVESALARQRQVSQLDARERELVFGHLRLVFAFWGYRGATSLAKNEQCAVAPIKVLMRVSH